MILRKVGYGMRKLDVQEIEELYNQWLVQETLPTPFMDFIREKVQEAPPSSDKCGTAETDGSCQKVDSRTSIEHGENTINDIVDEHWEWVKGLLDSLDDYSYEDCKLEEYLYKTAFKHGYKHALEGHYPAKEGA